MDRAQISSVETDLNTPTAEDIDGGIKGSYLERLQSSHSKLLDGISSVISLVLANLYSNRVVDRSTYENLLDINKNQTSRDATTKLLLYLDGRSFEDFFWFCECLIFAVRSPRLCHQLLVGDEDWEQLNEIRRERHEKDQSLDLFVEIPKWITDAQLKDLEDEIARLSCPQAAADVSTETVPKQVETPSSVEYSRTQEYGLIAFPTDDINLEEFGAADETVPKVLDHEEADSRGQDEVAMQTDSAPSPERDPQAWLNNMRSYQLELAEPAAEDINYIVNAPTGSGKTRVATYIIYEHLKKTGTSGRVLFLCPEVNLVRQQYKVLKESFKKKYRVEYLVGEEVADKQPIHAMVKRNHVVVVTPAIIENALMDKSRKIGLHNFSLMIFDECHHTTGDHMYNKLMSRYVDTKLNNEELFKHYPQVIGMTASLGVGKANICEEAVQHVLRMCANMDSKKVAVVTKNAEELAAFSNTPFEETQRVEERKKDDPFLTKITDVMKKIEAKIVETIDPENKGFERFLIEFPEEKYNDFYRICLTRIKRGLKRMKPEVKLIVLPCLEFLMAFYHGLDMHLIARASDAVIVLQRKLDGRPRAKVEEDKKPEIEKWLEGIYNGIKDELVAMSENDANPRLAGLKQVILKAFKDEPDSYCILFTKTRLSTEAIKGWINEDEDMKPFNAERLTGATSEENYGISNKRQESVLKNFKNGKHKIIIATSVAEEGLDIQACNRIIRYDYMTNEIGRVQIKGRARMEYSRVVNVVGEDRADVVDKEMANLHREAWMISAVKKVQRIIETAPDTFAETIRRFQMQDMHVRLMKRVMKEARDKSKSSSRFMLLCAGGCGRTMCFSDEIVSYDEASKHTCVGNDFHEKITIKKHRRKPKKFDDYTKLHKVFCNNPDCRYDIGVVFRYKEQIYFPVIKANAFDFFEMKPNGEKGEAVDDVSGWDDAPCRFEEISEADLINHFKSRMEAYANPAI